jgi:site-specific DNA recombinase
LLDLLGVHSHREVARARFRTTAAMQVQTELQGRRPPSGYMLVDAGPHPSRVHASWGRRLHRLEPDPDTAPHVQWIFELYLSRTPVEDLRTVTSFSRTSHWTPACP